MTEFENPITIKCLDHGTISLLEVMGSDSTIADSARVSYGEGTKAVSDDRALIRYLMRNHHTSPLEMGELRFKISAPLFVMRQWIRTRTANVNEVSARYSILPDIFYVPAHENIAPQSINNKQGRSGTMTKTEANAVQSVIKAVSETNFELYHCLLGDYENKNNAPYDLFTEDMLGKDFGGIARELARMILPLNAYTTWIWKCDINNIFKFLNQRLDLHAQYEIRVYAEAMMKLIIPHFPIACEAFEDYIYKAESFSKQEMDLVRSFFDNEAFEESLGKLGSNSLSKRELEEFNAKIGGDKNG